jgi:hypothetical protein
VGNLAEYGLSHRFVPPPATLPHERLMGANPTEEDLHREASSYTLDREASSGTLDREASLGILDREASSGTLHRAASATTLAKEDTELKGPKFSSSFDLFLA